ncbi:MAG: type II secretion system protein [Candidatus Azambacteria bacterium]|nr:type II secretion system protein [Candidatus Azambacteria bacterium]
MKKISQDCFINNKKEAGFTLLETIVATSVIVTALVSSLTLINSSLVLASNFGDRLVASNLAAEGIEVLRNIRDNNWLQTLSWNNGLSDGNYNVAYNSLSLTSFSDTPLKLNSLNGVYDYSSGSNQTVFKRKVSITNLSSYEIRIVSTVSWQRRSRAYSVAVEDHLFSWK